MAMTFAKKRADTQPAAVASTGPVPMTQDAPRSRRRPAVIGAGLAMAAVGSLVAVWQFDAASDRVSVIAVAHDVAAGDVVKASDLVVAQVAPDPALAPVPVSRQEDIIGKRAAADLPQGTLITDASVRLEEDVSAGKDTVGILAAPGQLPARSLRAGDRVFVVFTPEQVDSDSNKSSSTPDSISAVVSHVSEPDTNGARVVDMAVAGTDSGPLATWAASGRVVIVLKASD
ncbi:SAF domain-containing protein [Streptomyces xiamenensis]|uniref:SAF domain-containing protein n=1 Tax=Streptomyces xiamenensis TaxID=408015 RepID=UPI0036EC202D